MLIAPFTLILHMLKKTIMVWTLFNWIHENFLQVIVALW